MSKVPRHLVLSVSRYADMWGDISRVAAWCAGLGVECVTIFCRGPNTTHISPGDSRDEIAKGLPLACELLWPSTHASLVRSWDALRRKSRHAAADVTFYEFNIRNEILNRPVSQRFIIRVLSDNVGRAALLRATKKNMIEKLGSTMDERINGGVKRTSFSDDPPGGLEESWERLKRSIDALSYIGENGETIEPQLMLYFSNTPGLTMGGYPPWELRFTEITRVGTSIECTNYSKFISMLVRHSRSSQNFGR